MSFMLELNCLATTSMQFQPILLSIMMGVQFTSIENGVLKLEFCSTICFFEQSCHFWEAYLFLLHLQMVNLQLAENLLLVFLKGLVFLLQKMYSLSFSNWNQISVYFLQVLKIELFQAGILSCLFQAFLTRPIYRKLSFCRLN